MAEAKKGMGVELVKAGVGCFATVLAAVIGGNFLLISTDWKARSTPSLRPPPHRRQLPRTPCAPACGRT